MQGEMLGSYLVSMYVCIWRSAVILWLGPKKAATVGTGP